MLNRDPLRSKKRESSEDSKGFGTADEGNTEASTSSESNFSQLFKNTCKTFESVNQQRKTTFQKEQREKYNELVDKNRELSEVFEVKEMGNLLIKDVEDEEENTSGDDVGNEMEDEVGNEMEDEVGNEMEEEVGSELANQMESEAEYDMANKIIQGKTEEPQKDESMETEASTATKKKKVICFRLTESQWLTEVPEDLSDKWLVKFCPKGSRRLILCNHRTTKVFDKYGIFQMEFHSKLPGGGGIPEFSSSTPGLTALDCVYHFPKKTFFVLDVMVWNCASFLHCEAELRLCWIRSKYIDNPECFEGYEQNSFRFEVVFDYPADPDTIAYQLSQYDTNCAVGCEGVLFYHKEAPYISGNTDCVTWLKPFMLQELMDIPVPREYELRKPPYYVDLSTYLEHLVEKTKNLKTKKKSKQKLRIIAQREIMTRLFKTEKMNMEISTIDAPIIEIPRRGTASMDTSAAQSSKMDIAP